MSEEFKEKVREKFKARQDELTKNLDSRNDDDFISLGKIVHYHQVVEDSIMRFLKMKIPDHNSLDKQLRMYGAKIAFFKGFEEANTFSRFYKALEELGQIRNKFAHSLNYNDVQQSDYPNIKIFSEQFKEYLGLNQDLGWVGDTKLFSIFFVTIMDGYISMVESKDERLEEINQAYLNVMDNFNNKEG